MCGICGIYGEEDKKTLRKMLNPLKHRGPDDEGIYLDQNISLGHRRLSIIDIKGGHQPIHNENENIWVILNGEIYNYKELTNKLEHNHEFYTRSDTEVLVHLYEEYGDNFVNKLNGMFSFALWDSEKKKLILGRDPLGKKPLYYYMDSHNLFFASEIKALLETGIQKKINFEAMSAFLGYQYSLGSNTLFKNIKKLPPGHLLKIDDGKVIITKYWEILMQELNLSENDHIKNLRKLLERSAKYRMVSDVPIGSFLSGGIDSSASIALTKKYADYPFHSFTAKFEDVSELKYGKIVSEYLDLINHEIYISSEMVSNHIDKITWYNDEPLGDAAIINNYFLANLAKKYVKVVIAGEGGDEVFGGYPIYKINNIYGKISQIPFGKHLTKICNYLPYSGDLFKNRFQRQMRILQSFNSLPFEEAYLFSTRITNNDEIKWLTNLNPNKIEINGFFGINFPNNPLNRMLSVDCKNLLPEKFLMKADKATMSHSIEERLPLIDKNIVNYAFTIPSNLKIKNGIEKYAFKMAVKDYLPKEIIKREKQGFGTPLKKWITNKGPLNDRLECIFDENYLINKVFEENKLKKLINHAKKETFFQNRYKTEILWTIFVLGLWYDQFFVE